jgi:hypothetical protein
VLKWFIILALPLTLGSKLLIRPDQIVASETDVQQKVAEFLVRQHFAVAKSDQAGKGQVMLRAGAGTCRILVANSDPIASDIHAIRRNATAADRVFVVFRGRIYNDQPTWLTVPYFLWSRFERELGFQSQPVPLIAVIASASCDAERLPWSELG